MRTALWMGVLVFVFAPVAARATIVIAMPEDELTRVAYAIFVGTVLAVSVRLDDGGRVMTRANIQVLRSLRGVKRNAVIAVEYPGGRLPNGLVAHVDGTPQLAVGDRVFGFAERHGATLLPLGLRYGMLRVHGDGRGGYLVTRDTDGLVLVDRVGKPAHQAVATLRGIPLETLIARVQGHLRALGIAPDAEEATR